MIQPQTKWDWNTNFYILQLFEEIHYFQNKKSSYIEQSLEYLEIIKNLLDQANIESHLKTVHIASEVKYPISYVLDVGGCIWSPLGSQGIEYLKAYFNVPETQELILQDVETTIQPEKNYFINESFNYGLQPIISDFKELQIIGLDNESSIQNHKVQGILKPPPSFLKHSHPESIINEANHPFSIHVEHIANINTIDTRNYLMERLSKLKEIATKHLKGPAFSYTFTPQENTTLELYSESHYCHFINNQLTHAENWIEKLSNNPQSSILLYEENCSNRELKQFQMQLNLDSVENQKHFLQWMDLQLMNKAIGFFGLVERPEFLANHYEVGFISDVIPYKMIGDGLPMTNRSLIQAETLQQSKFLEFFVSFKEEERIALRESEEVKKSFNNLLELEIHTNLNSTLKEKKNAKGPRF